MRVMIETGQASRDDSEAIVIVIGKHEYLIIVKER